MSCQEGRQEGHDLPKPQNLLLDDLDAPLMVPIKTRRKVLGPKCCEKGPDIDSPYVLSDCNLPPLIDHP